MNSKISEIQERIKIVAFNQETVRLQMAVAEHLSGGIDGFHDRVMKSVNFQINSLRNAQQQGLMGMMGAPITSFAQSSFYNK